MGIWRTHSRLKPPGPHGGLWRWEPDRRYNIFNPPAHQCRHIYDWNIIACDVKHHKLNSRYCSFSFFYLKWRHYGNIYYTVLQKKLNKYKPSIRLGGGLFAHSTISQLYTWRQTDVQRTKESGPTVGIPRNGHLVGFFNVMVQARTRGYPFLRLYGEIARFQSPFMTRMGIWRNYFHLN